MLAAASLPPDPIMYNLGPAFPSLQVASSLCVVGFMQCLHIQCVLSLMWTAEQIVRCVLSVFVYPGTENCEQIPSVGSPVYVLTAIFQVNLG